MESTKDTLKESFAASRDDILSRYFRFLRFESVSTDPAYRESVRECSSWLSSELTGAGFRTSIWETSGHPTVFAERHAGDHFPTVLIYGHYDVQPVDPLELWHSPPFEPTIRDGQVFARGAQDNKGQFWGFFEGVKCCLQQNPDLPLNIKFVVEGEEEVGSPGLQEILTARKRELKADYALVVDCGIPSLTTPAVTVGLRGICLLTVILRGAASDLHSGLHGGVAKNPIQALVELLSKLHSPDGSIAIPGFYDEIVPIAEDERALINFSFDRDEYERSVGVPPLGGEQALSPNERRWLRPTVEINGISGGYVGKGTKGIIPSEAFAKLSCRLVPGMDPEKTLQLLERFLLQHVPAGVRLELQRHSGYARPIRTSPKAFITEVCRTTLSEVFGREACCVLEGWTVPVTSGLVEVAEAEVAMIGLALPDDQVHAPNEHFGLDRLEMQYAWAVKIMESLAEHAARAT